MCTLCGEASRPRRRAARTNGAACVGFRLGRPLPDGRRLRLDDPDQRLRHAIRSIRRCRRTGRRSSARSCTAASSRADRRSGPARRGAGRSAARRRSPVTTPTRRRSRRRPRISSNAPAAKEIVTHEYGHHVANNSLDTPFDAEAYGTKRWASYMNICKRAVAGELFPGDEGDNYQENPGEAYAESLPRPEPDEAGRDPIGWDIVDRCSTRTRPRSRCSSRTSRPRGKGRRCPTCTARSATAPSGRSSRRPRSTGRSSPACTPRRSRGCRL